MLVTITRTQTWDVPEDGGVAQLVDYDTVRAEEQLPDGSLRLLNLDDERDEGAYIRATLNEPDTASSASRQHYIDTGRYLNRGDA